MSDNNPIAELTKAVGWVEKDGENKHSNYRYQSEAAVKLAVQKAIKETGVAPKRIVFEVLEDEWLELKSGKKGNMVKLRCTIVMADERVNTGDVYEGVLSYEGLGSSLDYADKAMMQAQTVAIREAWKNMLCIPSGGDAEEKTPEIDPVSKPSARAKKAEPDADDPHEPAPPGALTPEQGTELSRLTGVLGLTREGVISQCREATGAGPNVLDSGTAVKFIAHLEGMVEANEQA